MYSSRWGDESVGCESERPSSDSARACGLGLTARSGGGGGGGDGRSNRSCSLYRSGTRRERDEMRWL